MIYYVWNRAMEEEALGIVKWQVRGSFKFFSFKESWHGLRCFLSLERKLLKTRIIDGS
ncbi:MAG: hypothetical protein ACTSVI_07690 [Promethearchaeota archaeon]